MLVATPKKISRLFNSDQAKDFDQILSKHPIKSSNKKELKVEVTYQEGRHPLAVDPDRRWQSSHKKIDWVRVKLGYILNTLTWRW